MQRHTAPTAHELRKLMNATPLYASLGRMAEHGVSEFTRLEPPETIDFFYGPICQACGNDCLH